MGKEQRAVCAGGLIVEVTLLSKLGGWVGEWAGGGSVGSGMPKRILKPIIDWYILD